MAAYALWAGVSMVFLATLYSHYNHISQSELVEDSIIDAWDAIIKGPQKKFSKVLVGINACVDLIVRGTNVLAALGLQPAQADDHPHISTLEQLQETFNYYFTQGAAVERYFTDGDLFAKIVEVASLQNPVQWHIGGNAALMAEKITSLFPDVEVQLVGPVGPKLYELLDSKVKVPHKSVANTDEVHLILEYSAGERWGQSVSPSATRLITSHDQSNSEASALEQFFDSISDYKPDLVILSGLHMLESQTTKKRTSRITVLAEHLTHLEASLPVHLELASMADPGFLGLIIQQVFPQVTAVGMNEQELAFASLVAGGPHPNLLSAKQPLIHQTSDTLLWLLQRYGRSQDNHTSKLTRIHFHSLTYHIIAWVSGSWNNVPAAVAAGTRVAGRQACNIPLLYSAKLELQIPDKFRLYSNDKERYFNASEPVMTWQIGNIAFAFSPVLVCKRPLKTVGLGDAISATGLLFSSYNHDK